MSDVQGTDVRGKGFVTVSGYSSASLLGGATSGYSATAIGGNSYTTGLTSPLRRQVWCFIAACLLRAVLRLGTLDASAR